MGLLSLYLSKPQVVWRQGEAGGFHAPGWDLTWAVRFDRFYNRVQLSTGGDLSKMPGYLTLRVGENLTDAFDEATEQEKPFYRRSGPPIGLLSFVRAYDGSSDGVIKPSTDSYSIRLNVGEAELQTMIDKVLRGHGPHSVRLSAPHIDYGNLPGGELQKWEVEDKDWTVLDQATFIFGHMGDAFDDDEEDEKSLKAGLPPPEKPSPEAVALQNLRQELKGGALWLYGLLGAILAALLLAR